MLLRMMFFSILSLLAGIASAQAQSLDGAAWRKELRATGTIFFFCQNDAICGAGAIDSYHRQPDGLYATFKRFQQHIGSVQQERLIQAGIEGTIIASADDSSRLGHHFTIMERQRFRDGHIEYFLDGYIEANALTFTLGASALSRRQTERNYRDLINHVRGIAKGI